MRAAVLLLALAIALLIGAEAYLRIFSPHVVDQAEVAERDGLPEVFTQFTEVRPDGSRRLVPGARVVIRNHFVSGNDVEVSVNALGLRGGEIPAGRSPGEYRVLALGDSITLGDHVAEDRTWVAVAQRYLRLAGGKPSATVINGGLNDAGTREEIDLLEEKADAIRPDLVLLAFYMNDSRPPWGLPGELGSRGWLRRHSLLADKVWAFALMRRWARERGIDRFGWNAQPGDGAWQTDRGAFLLYARQSRFDWGAAWTEESWPAVEGEFARLARVASARGARVAVVVFPVAFQVLATFNEDYPQRRVAELARRHGFPLLDLLPSIREAQSRSESILFYDWCHPTERGNEIVGLQVGRFLSRLP